MSIPLAALEDIIDASGAAPAIEAALPAGIRPRQLTVRTLFLGILLTLADDRPAHLTRVHKTLTALPGADQARLGVTGNWAAGPHQLTYRQVEYTFTLVARTLSKDEPDGAPSDDLARTCDDLLEASIPAPRKDASSALAADWTDVESWSRPPRHGTAECADPEASWGHRNSNLPGPKGEMFFGYYLSAATMTREENGQAVPELARRMTLCSCHLDPARALVPVLQKMPAAGIPLGDILADSGYAHRDAGAWAIPLRHAGAQLIQDLHPHDRGPRGTHHGAIIANGNLYCPQTPQPLLELGPLPHGATTEETAVHDTQAAELAKHKLGRLTADDADGYHRVTCPAAAGKIRCPCRPESMTLDRGPARDPHPARPPARLLHPADHHRPRRRRGQDPAKTRLPVPGAPPLLHPAHQLRANLLHHQRPRHHQHRPRLVPPHRPDPAHPVDHLPAHRPQPAHPHRVRRPPDRHRPQSRTRPAAQNPQTQTQDPRHARRRPVTPAARNPPAISRCPAGTQHHQPARDSMRPNHTQPASHHQSTPECGQRSLPRGARRNVRPKREHGSRSNVKTSEWS